MCVIEVRNATARVVGDTRYDCFVVRVIAGRDLFERYFDARIEFVDAIELTRPNEFPPLRGAMKRFQSD